METAASLAGPFPITASEVTAGVTPSNLNFPELQIERYGGKADGATDNATAFSNSNLVLTAKGGGRLNLLAGTYNTSGALLLAGKAAIQGAGMQSTIIQYTGSGTFITFTPTGGSNDIRDLAMLGTGKTGIGIQFGDATASGFAGLCKLSRVWLRNWSTGVRFGAALWATLEDCRIDLNTVGVDFNASNAANRSAVVRLTGNYIAFNDHEGIAASNTPVRNQCILIQGGSIEQNGVTDLTRYQLQVGSVQELTVENVYFEYAAGGTKANGINLTNANNFAIRECIFNTLTTCISATIANNGLIQTCRFTGTITNDLNLSGGANVHDILVDTSNILSGVTNVLAGANVWADASNVQNTTWPVAPTIKGASVAGTPTYTVQAAQYTKWRNLVFFQLRVSISAKTGISGALSIEGLPVASVMQAGVATIFAAEYLGITVSGANTYLYAELANNSTSLLLMQGGSTTNTQLLDTNLAAAATIQISGTYQAAT